MTTFFKLPDYIKALQTKLSSANIIQVTDEGYYITGVTEEDLMSLGFEFDSYDITDTIPTYKNNNLFACFINDSTVYITESTTSY